MSGSLTLQQVQDARAARDPKCVLLLCQLLEDGPAEDGPPVREGVYTFDHFIAETNTASFRSKSVDEQAQYRMQRLSGLESSDAEIPLPDELRSHEVLMDLWQADDAFSRRCLLEAIDRLPIKYGPFKAFKRIFKEAEAAGDTEVYGALGARFDMALDDNQHNVSKRTLAYLCRRAWRYLRRLGETLPAAYPDAASDFLVHYRSDTRLRNSWIFNHVLFHETGKYTAKAFQFGWSGPKDLLKNRAFADAWKRSPRPLFSLLERAQSELVREYATRAIKSDFRAAIRDVEPEWPVRLAARGSETLDSFVVWILDNVPRFEQAKFRELGLHETVLGLFDSGSRAAIKYACAYARTHARDLDVDRLIELASKSEAEVRKLGVDLLLSRDPRKDIGLDAWGQLLDTEFGSEVAVSVLRKHFGVKELAVDWFTQRLKQGSGPAFEFAKQRLTEIHPLKKLGQTFFIELISQLDDAVSDPYIAGDYAMEQLAKIGPETIEPDALRLLLVNPYTSFTTLHWVHQGTLKPSLFGADFLKRIAYHRSFETDPWVAEQKKTPWGKHLAYNEYLAENIFAWLSDVREFSPADLGFEWLMTLVEQTEPRYHDFAVTQMIKAFVPADFATTTEAAAPAEDPPPSEEINVDLEGASFLFTGKLKTMTRSEAKGKVTAAGGANSGTVGKKLDYLVIGDDGSPLYGEGRKGSKQVKAESLIEEGAPLKIISETAFLQMLAGEVREFSEDAVTAGCEYLWSQMVDSADHEAPLARFARRYIRLHHPEISLKETDRPVDPGAEMPDGFMTFDRFLPLFADARVPLRELALEFAGYEMARWSPPIAGLVAMCDSPYPEVRDFVAKAMTCDDAIEHRRYRVDSEVLTADAVYSFCESKTRETRELGIRLIDMHPRLRLPDELFRLTESADRNVRAFVIRTFWSLYRDRGIKRDWKPTPPPASLIKKGKSKKQVPIEEDIGTGVPERPSALPAELARLKELLRRILFEIPPGPPPRDAKVVVSEGPKLKPSPARLAKLNLIETLRDLAIEDAEFAELIMPLFEEFRQSRGKSEQAACLVAVTRIKHAHGVAKP